MDSLNQRSHHIQPQRGELEEPVLRSDSYFCFVVPNLGWMGFNLHGTFLRYRGAEGSYAAFPLTCMLPGQGDLLNVTVLSAFPRLPPHTHTLRRSVKLK